MTEKCRKILYNEYYLITLLNETKNVARGMLAKYKTSFK